MKRFTAVLAGLTLIFGLAAAQFPDVPQDHWAYQACDELQRAGIIKGYPDGTFKGQRPLTRYEFADAIANAYRNLNQRLQELSDRIARIPTDRQPTPPGVDEQARADIKTLQQQVAELQRLNEALQTLQRLAQTFQQEMASMGVDIDALKKDVAALNKKVDELMGKKEKLQWSGDLTGGFFHPHRFEDDTAITLNAVNFGRKAFTLHELGLGFNAQINENVTANALLTFGNYLSYLGTTSAVPAAYNPNVASPTDITLWEAYVKFPIDLFGTTLNVMAGRIPVKGTPFTLQRVNPDWYLDFPRYDDGAFRVDGGMGTFDWGSVRLRLGAARVDSVQSSNNSLWSQFTVGVPAGVAGHPIGIQAGPVAVTKMAGAELEVDVLKGENSNATIGVGYMSTSGGPPATAPNGSPYHRVDVLGADLKAKFATRFNLNVEFAQSLLYRGDDRVEGLDENSWALNAALGYDFSDNFNLGVGWREVRPFFGAPGYWGRIGFWYNPHDVRGFYAKASYKFSEDFAAHVKGEFYEGSDRIAGGLTDDDKVNRVLAGVNYKLSDKWNLSFDYEGVFWRARSAALTGTGPDRDPVENYFTLGVGYNLGENTMLKFLYQVIDYDAKGLGTFQPAGTTGRNRTGVAAATLSVKF